MFLWHRLTSIALAVALTLLSEGRGWAQDRAPIVAPEVVIEGVEPEAPAEDESTSVEVIDLDDRTAGTTLADILQEVSGVRVNRLGGLESYTTVSIRGSTAAQVLVLRDGVPLNAASGAEVNLSEVSLDEIERIEVYRGASPGHFGTGGMGGVINLVSRRDGGGRAARAELGLGAFMPGSFDPGRFFSFSAKRSVSVMAAGRVGPADLLATANLWDTEGDFVFLDDNGTLANLDDDRFVRRVNNDATQGDLMLRGAIDLPDDLRLSLAENLGARSQGVPGLGGALASSARLRLLQSTTLVELSRPRPRGGRPRFDLRLSTRLRRDEWLDRDGEIGVGREHDDDLTLDITAAGRVGWPLRRLLGVAWLSAELRRQQYWARSRLEPRRAWSFARTSGALGFWVTWSLAGGLLELTPQARLELAHDGPVGEPTGGGEGSTELFASEQLGLVVQPRPWLRLRSSGGATQRPATFLELLGNRGTVVGNPALEPESGWFVDAGVQVNGHRGALEVAQLEVTGFYRQVDDLIQLVPNSQVTFVATNVGAATIAGLEATGHGRLDWGRLTSRRMRGWIDLRAGVTFMDAVDRSERAYLEGRQLPLRPRWQFFGRLELGVGPVALAYELDYTSGNFLDPYNSFAVPHRLLHAAELIVDLRRWRGPTLTLRARNLTDRITEEVPVQAMGQLRRPVADVAGFPLPGLTVFLTLRWELPDFDAPPAPE